MTSQNHQDGAEDEQTQMSESFYEIHRLSFKYDVRDDNQILLFSGVSHFNFISRNFQLIHITTNDSYKERLLEMHVSPCL